MDLPERPRKPRSSVQLTRRSHNFRWRGEVAVRPATEANSQQTRFRGLPVVAGPERREHQSDLRRGGSQLSGGIWLRHVRQHARWQKVHARSLLESWHVRATVEQLHVRLRHDQFYWADV